MLEKLGLPQWAIEAIVSIAIVFIAWVVSELLVLILNLVKRHIASRTATDLDDHIIDALKRPIRWVAIYIGVAIALQRLEATLPEDKEWVFKLTDGIIYVAIAWVVMVFLLRLVKVITGWYGKTVAARTETSVDTQLMPLVRRVLRVLIIVVALVTVLDRFNIDVKGLLAVLGLGSLAIALAAQDTIANMISGFIIMIDRPFRKGDRVVLPNGEKADVYDIGLRSSKFLTFENTLIVVPNQDLTKSTITNLTYPEEQIRVKIDVGVAYGSNIEKVKEILIRCAREHPDVLAEPAPGAFFLNFGESSLDFTVVCRVRKVREQWPTTEAIRCRIYEEFEKAGVEIPFPQRVVHLHPTRKAHDDSPNQAGLGKQTD